MQYEYLSWDSSFFGFKVARIGPEVFDFEALGAVLNTLKKEGFQLVYWSSELESPDAALLNGFLVDKKLTYLQHLKTAPQNAENPVEAYSEPEASAPLLELGVQSGEFSRFRVDDRLPYAKFKALYETWIVKSVRKQIAEEVLIYPPQSEPLGLITLGKKNNRADIGIVAVRDNARGQGIGKQLIYSALNWFWQKNQSEVQVVTQGYNAPACALYEKTGFYIDKTEYFYHFWL